MTVWHVLFSQNENIITFHVLIDLLQLHNIIRYYEANFMISSSVFSGVS